MISHKSKPTVNYWLFLLVFFAFALRIFGINWDQGFHIHPDERMILMVAATISFFKNLNPNFFNYGSLPIYLLKGVSQLLSFILVTDVANYQNMLYVGRVLSVLFDCGTVLLVYYIAQHLWHKEKLSLVSALAYSITFFVIQNSHFYTVDTFLTFLTTLLILIYLRFVRTPTEKIIITAGIVFAAMTATKFTSLVFYPLIFLVLFFNASPLKTKCRHFLIFHFSFFIFNFIFMPYQFLDFPKFSQDIHQQLMMGRDPYFFPYTLQFVATLPYWHYIKNIALWGLGPFLSLLSMTGIILIAKNGFKHKEIVLLFCFYTIYVIIVGATAVKFMRYMLPVYPFFAVTAGYSLYWLHQLKSTYGRVLFWSFLILSCVWLAMFLNIYTEKHTRISASNWMNNNIPPGSTIAVEYWDDYLPIFNPNNYTFNVLHMYETPDDERKWQTINNQLNNSDYLVIASNRMYAPIQKLRNCSKYRVCFPIASTYYDLLFRGKYGFNLVKQFSVYPFLQLGPWKLQIDDQGAEESFTVYDHPKVMIFKKAAY